jgi:LysM repeat protein
MGNTWRKVLRVTTGFAVPLLAAGVITAGSPGLGQYKVKHGDTLSYIAATYGTNVRTLVALNNLPGNGNAIYAGEVLQLPGKAPKQGPAKKRSQLGRVPYVVKAGDTIGKLAKRFRCSQANLLAANGLRVTDHIYIGKQILIPVKIVAKPVAHKRPVAKKPGKKKNNTFAGRTYADHIVSAADANRAALSKRKLPTRAQMRTMIIHTAKRYHVDPELALAISWQESGWKQRVVSPANAIGTMQVIPSSGEWASQLVGRKLNLLDPYDNATAGVAIIRALVSTSKDLDNAIAGYYQGQYSVSKYGMYDDTKTYVAAIKAHQKNFR